MSKLREAWEDIRDTMWPSEVQGMEFAITEAEETIARLTRERDKALERIKVMDEALANIERRATHHPDDTDEENRRQLRHILSAARAARKEPT